MITVNGKQTAADGQTLYDFLLFCGYDIRCVVVEINRQIIKKDNYSAIILKEGDSLEILSFVGGG